MMLSTAFGESFSKLELNFSVCLPLPSVRFFHLSPRRPTQAAVSVRAQGRAALSAERIALVAGDLFSV